jgi:hypothetical protein
VKTDPKPPSTRMAHPYPIEAKVPRFACVEANKTSHDQGHDRQIAGI